jgi:hypothetical protein
MNIRSGDPEGSEHEIQRQRGWRLGSSTAALVLTFITALGSLAYSAVFVKFQTDQNTKDIDSDKQTQAKLWATRDADKNVTDERLRHIEEKLDILIGESHGTPHR